MSVTLAKLYRVVWPAMLRTLVWCVSLAITSLLITPVLRVCQVVKLVTLQLPAPTAFLATISMGSNALHVKEIVSHVKMPQFASHAKWEATFL